MNENDQKQEVTMALEIVIEELANLNVFVYEQNEVKTLAFLKQEIEKEKNQILAMKHDEQLNESLLCLKVDSANFKILNQLNIQKVRVCYELIESMIESDSFDLYYETLENTIDALQAIKTMCLSIDYQRRVKIKESHDEAIMHIIDFEK
jgi:hypothetical protein